MEKGESKVKQVLSTLWSYMYSSLPPNEDFIIQLEIGGILARNDATKLRASARLGGRACIHDLIIFMNDFFDEPALETFCTFLDKYGQPNRPLMLEVAAKIREEMGLKPQQVHEPAPEDPQKGTSKPRADVAHGTSSADMSQHDVYYPVIDDLKPSFSNLAGNVLSTIDLLSFKNLKTFCNNFLLNYLRPSFPPNAPLPVIPETVEDLKPFLASRWDPLQIALLKAVVERLASRNIQGGNFKATVKKVKYELNTYEDLLKRKLPEFLSECRNESVSLKSYPGQSFVSAKIASNPAEISLSRIMKLRDFFIHNLGFRCTLFTGFSEGCIVLFFSIPTECVWSLPSCLHPSNLSQLEEWKVLFLSVEGAFTVDIKERRVIDSLDKPRLQPALKSVLQPYGPSNVAGSETQRQARTGDGEDGVIENTTALLPYLDDLAADLLLLGTVLGTAKTAIPTITVSPNSIIIQILLDWRSRQSQPTWALLHEKLQKNFSDTASAIETDHKDMSEEIKDVGQLMGYFDGLLNRPILLGVALGIPEQAKALIQNKPGSSHGNCLIILGDYIRCTPHCTWKKFYDQLKSCSTFESVVHRIKKDHIVDALEIKPKEKELQKIADNCGHEWKALLTNVGVLNAQIQQFQVNAATTQDACFAGLVFWRDGNAEEPATWSILLEAMEEAKMVAYAREWKKKIIDSCSGQSGSGKPGNGQPPTPAKEVPSDVPKLTNIKDFMEHFKDKFLEDVAVEDVMVDRFKNNCVIPETVYNRVMKEDTSYGKRSKIWNQVRSQGVYETVEKLCKAMIATENSHKTIKLGKKMEAALIANKAVILKNEE